MQNPTQPNSFLPQPPAEILTDPSALRGFYETHVVALHSEKMGLEAKVAQLEGALTEIATKLEGLFSDLRDIFRRNSKNSSMPPSKDSFYGRVSLDNLLKEHGLGDFTAPKKASCATSQTPEAGTEQPSNSDFQGAASSQESPSQAAASAEAKQKPEKSGASPASKNQPTRKAHHPGASQKLAEPDEVVVCPPTECPSCGSTEFTDITDDHIEQFVEALEKLVKVTHYIIQKGTCACCGKQVSGKVPEEKQNMGFGVMFQALIAWLICVCVVSRRHLQAFVERIMGVNISQGGIDKIVKRVAIAIKPYYDRIAELARSAPVNHIDETSSPVFGPPGSLKHWMWGMFNRRVCFFKIHASLAKESFQLLIGPWRGILVSDDYGTYIKWENGRQTCLSHLIRAARAVSECDVPRIAECGTWLLSFLRNLHKKKGEQWTAEEVAALKADFDARAQQYKHVGGKASTLVKRLLEEFDAMTYFLTHPEVDPDNNFAERCLRSYVVFRKMGYGVTSEDGEAWLERILSLSMTCNLHGVSLYEKLAEALECYYKGTTPNLDWLEKEPEEAAKEPPNQ